MIKGFRHGLFIALLSMAVASCGGGEGGKGGASAGGNGPAVPSAPQNLSVSTGPGIQRTTVSWDPVSGAASYNLYWSNSPLVSKATGTKLTNVTSPFTHSGLNAGAYYYVVAAVDANGESAESSPVSAPVHLVSFVTSTMGNANLSSWPDAVSAGSVTGLAAGDAVCQARALASGLTGTFKAWLSSSTTDAYCHVQELSGKKSSKCGQVTLPATAGPWVRTDGAPFAPTIDTMTSSPFITYTPLVYDESGTLFPDAYQQVATNSLADGSGLFSGPFNACSDWTDGSTVMAATGGYVYMTMNYSVSGFGLSCDQTHPLLCVQAGAGVPLSILPASGKKVFVTSTTYDGNLGGLSGADAKCQAQAEIAGLAHSANFKAWLSDGSTDAISRLTGTGPWVRLDGIKVADNKTDLTNGAIFTSISMDELGNYVSTMVWTGTNAVGTKEANTCNSWADNSATQGSLGDTSGAYPYWTARSNASCASTWPLYCFED